MLGDLTALKLPLNAKYSQFNTEEPFKIDTWKVCHLLEGWKTPIKISKDMWKKFSPNPNLKSSQGSSQTPSQLSSSQDTTASSVIPPTGTVAIESGTTHSQSQTDSQAMEGTIPQSVTSATSTEGSSQGDLNKGSEVRENGPGPANIIGTLSEVSKVEGGVPQMEIKQEPVDVSQPSQETKADLPNGDQSQESAGQGTKRKAEDDQVQPADKKLKLEIPETPGQSTAGNNVPDKENCPTNPPIIIITGFNKKRAAQLTGDITKLGGRMTTSAAGATHLISSSISRTVKFLTALSVVKHVVRPDWIDRSAQEGKFLPEENFTLNDEATEGTFNFKLSDSIKRANSAKLFKELTFYLTPGIYPSKKLLIDIIQSGGGTVVDRRPSTRVISTKITPQGLPTFVVVTCQDDLHLCRDLADRKLPVHNAEFVLTGVMRQEVDFQAYRIL